MSMCRKNRNILLHRQLKEEGLSIIKTLRQNIDIGFEVSKKDSRIGGNKEWI